MIDTPAVVAAHLDAIFLFDGRGRIAAFREEPEAAPRFVLVRTRAGHQWRFGAKVPDATAGALASLAAAEPRELTAWPLADREFRRILARDAPIEDVRHGLDHVLPEALPDSGEAMKLGPEHRDALAEHFPVTVELFAQRQPVYGIIDDGAVVARCCSIGDEAGVDVVEGYRRRGYATQVTAAWARGFRAMTGRQPLYSHSGDNLPSLGVARRLGALQYGVDYEIT